MTGRVRPAWRPFPVRPWVGHTRTKAVVAEPAHIPDYVAEPDGLVGYYREPAGIDLYGKPLFKIRAVESQRLAAKCWRKGPKMWASYIRKPNVIKARRA